MTEGTETSTEPTPDRGASAGGRKAAGEIVIDAPPERVWHALTEADELVRWFPLGAEVEPGEGGSMQMSWDNEFQGDAEILVWSPPVHLRTEWTWGGAVTDYYLDAEGGGTRLRVVTSGFPEGEEWDAWLEGTARGWAFELFQLKHYLEEHSGCDREVVYLRRLVPGSPDEAWSRLSEEGMTDLDWAGDGPVDEVAPIQVAGVVKEPVEGLYRLSTHPAHGRTDTVDVTLWLSAWGGGPADLESVRTEWAALLERVFPEGESP